MTHVLVLSRTLLGAGIHSALARFPNWQVLRTSTRDPTTIVELGQHFLPEVTILDDTSGEILCLLEQLGQQNVGQLGMKMVVTAAYQCEETLFLLARWGVAAYLSDELPLEHFVSTLQRVSSGEWLLSERLRTAPPRVPFELKQHETAPVIAGTLPSPLSPREAEVLTCTARGMTNEQIAGSLGIGNQAVKNCLSSCYKKLGTTDRTGAVVSALRLGWIQFPACLASPETPFASVA